MALRIREMALSLNETEALLPAKIAAALNLRPDDIRDWKIVRKGIDARRKPEVLLVYSIEFSCDNEEKLLAEHGPLNLLEAVRPEVAVESRRCSCKPRILVAGMGPAGLFSALTLAESGALVTLVERGAPVERRLRDVKHFWAGGELDPESNIQFGEGGAGTFSDGKLSSRISHPAMRHVLHRLVEFGAPEEILWQAKPHIGSDRLRSLLINFRKHLLAIGVDIRFFSRLTGFEMHAGGISAGQINDSEMVDCDQLVLALGHSARDTYQMLSANRVALEQKPFAIGLRVEHPLELINRIQYGMERHSRLPSADYRLAWNDPETGRGVYSFCMCPGGMVINAASEPGGIVVNGMSDFRRDAPHSNSALVVSISGADFPGTDPLAGIRLQRKWEQAAYLAGGAGWNAPAQPLLEFLSGRGGRLLSSCQPRVVHADLTACLPGYVSEALRKALPHFNRKMQGFISQDATLIGVETRTSAPLRILRDQRGESVSHKGLFPVGEGAGYAGGIMSAAVDGIRVASGILQSYS